MTKPLQFWPKDFDITGVKSHEPKNSSCYQGRIELEMHCLYGKCRRAWIFRQGTSSDTLNFMPMKRQEARAVGNCNAKTVRKDSLLPFACVEGCWVSIEPIMSYQYR